MGGWLSENNTTLRPILNPVGDWMSLSFRPSVAIMLKSQGIMPDIPLQPDSANIFVKTVYYGAGLFMQSSLA